MIPHAVCLEFLVLFAMAIATSIHNDSVGHAVRVTCKYRRDYTFILSCRVSA